MKKISTAAALLAAGALLFGSLIVACSPHGTGIIDEVTNPGKGPEQEPEDNGKPVDGTWDFTGTDTYSIGTNDAIITDKALANPTAKGATLSVKGNLKWGNGTDDASSYSFWFKKASAYEEGKAASKAAGYLALTTDSKATLTIVYDAGGDNEGEKRWIAVCDSSDKPVSNAALISNLIEKNVYKTLKLSGLKKGSYKIYVSGTRIRSLQITNQAFESKTADVTNDVATLGLVAIETRNSDDTIATSEVKNGKVVITSKKEGTTKVYAGTSLTEYATINVTVSSTGAITTSIIKYVAFTAATNDATANDVATLGLVGASATSSESEYVTAEISEGKIVIKSVKAPGDSAKSITITVTDANSKTATIAVTEARDGSLTVGTITKYERNAPVKDTDYTVNARVLTATNPIEYSTDAGSTWTALAASESYTATQNGSVKVRFAANDSYAASKDASVQLTDGNGGSVNAKFTMQNNIGDSKPLGSATASGGSAENLENVIIVVDESGTGATLKFTGNVKKEAQALNVQKTGSISVTNDFANAKGCFTIELSASAKITVNYKSSQGSSSDESASSDRFIVVASTENVAIDSVKTTAAAGAAAQTSWTTSTALSAGTYKIFVNGNKIYYIEAKTE